MTPALLIFRDVVSANIATTIRLLDGNADRWRPHVKTAKVGYVMRMLTTFGVSAFKCATSLELVTAIGAGASDVLVAYPLVGANASRVRAIVDRIDSVAISVLLENISQIESWRGSKVGIFIDINPGMNRTGIEQDRPGAIVELARCILQSGLQFLGLHYYDGHLASASLPERTQRAHAGYDQLMSIIAALNATDISVKEVVTAGTPAFPCSLSYPGFSTSKFLHRTSPGTIVYFDTTAMEQLPSEWCGYAPSVLVMSRVVSRPTSGVITCDAGHKTVSVDCGVPNCAVAGMPQLQPLTPSEEHLPIRVPDGMPSPDIGDCLYLIPRHVCPTVNNFDRALIVEGGNILGTEQVNARGREGPMLPESYHHMSANYGGFAGPRS